MIKQCLVCNEMKEFGRRQRALTCVDCISKGYKYCSDCGTVKKLGEFRGTGEIRSAKCIPCDKEYAARKSRELYANSSSRREYVKQAVKDTRDTAKGHKAANSYSAKYYESPKGKAQNTVSSKAWYSTPEGKLYAKNKSHRRRAITNEGNVSLVEWQTALNYFNNACAYCSSEDSLTMDHVEPLNNNGEHCISNVVPACSYCNSSKSDKDLLSWYQTKDYFTDERFLKIIEWRNINERD